MRYITNADGYISAVSFGGEIECADGICTEYTGRVPTGYISLVDWYADECEKLYRWKVVDGQLTIDGEAEEPAQDDRWVGGLTDADKAEIAQLVDDVTVVQAPTYVLSEDDMVDPEKVYALVSTGHVWAYVPFVGDREVEITDNIVGITDNPYEVGRLSGTGTNAEAVAGYVLTPYIDLTKEEYQGKTIQLHLDGCRYASAAAETYIMCATYDSRKANILGRAYTMQSAGGILDAFDNAGVTLDIISDKSATLTIPVPLVGDDNKTVGYMRFCGKGTEAASSIYITYTGIETTTGAGFADTGRVYAPYLTNAEKTEIAEEAAAMVDADLLSLIGSGEVMV